MFRSAYDRGEGGLRSMNGSRKGSSYGVLVAAVALLASMVALSSAAAAGAATGPKWKLSTIAPESVEREGHILIDTWVENTGTVPLTGELTITDTFPAGIVARPPTFVLGTSFGHSCKVTGQATTCTVNVEGMAPHAEVLLRFLTFVSPTAEGSLVNAISASGGGAPGSQQNEEAMTVGPPEPFGIKTFGMGLLDGSGEVDSHAGSAPAEAANTLRFRTAGSVFVVAPNESFRDVVVHTPAGMVGYPLATPVRCTATELAEPLTGLASKYIPNCPLDSQVGVARVLIEVVGLGPQTVPVYNMVPRPGAPAEFGFYFDGILIHLVAKLRPSDYGVDLESFQSPSTLPISGVDVTLWGVPADNSHEYQRGACLDNYYGDFQGAKCPTGVSPNPFLRTPTSCPGTPLPWSTEVSTYLHPDTFVHPETSTPAMTGCEFLPFAPSFSLAPGELVPHVPTGVDATFSMPQETSTTGLAEADLRTATVNLPAGVAINPSSADGLQACSDEQLKLGIEGVATCPEAARIGTVTVTSPSLAHPVGGSIWLRPQASSDPASGDMFRVALEIRSDDDGIDVKLPAQIKVDPSTGQLTTVIAESPQLPVSSVALHFKDGPRAPLATPRDCGTYTTTGTFTSWSGKTRSTSSQFSISGDGHGAPCAAPGFAPAIKAGSINNRAQASSPFTLRLTRSDADQPLSTLSALTLPPGLTGEIASVPVRCSDAQAAAAACPEASRLGNVTVGVGTGPNPFYITDGNTYLTGPYGGAPFGLASIIHAKAGPFDLGNVIVRSAISIDPNTAQAIVRTDPLPTIVKGVPVQLRDLRVTVDRPGFMLNPTNCHEMQIQGTATSTQGATAALSSRFQASDCATLSFKPSFTASTRGKTSRREGASLDVKVGFPAGAQANIAKVKVSLPRAMPSRLETLKLACRDEVFEANPAACPVASRVGTAVAHTPLLASALSGPAYLVSHGGAQFPDLVIVLQGEGVVLHLTGNTNIVNSITTSTFNTVPDVPVSSFALNLPQGRYSVLGAPSGNLCGKTLAMPTTLTAQNGAVIKQSTHLAVTGCKAALTVRRHSVKGATASVLVGVPLAGRLSASGAGIHPVRRKVTVPGDVALSLALTQGQQRFLAAHPGKRLRVHVKLALAPQHGPKLSSSLTLLMG